MLLMMEIRRSIESWEAVRFPVERKKNDQRGAATNLYPHLLVWEAERI